MARATETRLRALVHAALGTVRLEELTDGELLTRYAQHRDEEAFAELVRRLGPAVYGVCRRVLGASPDADDAFQVVFLVLARKAASVRPPSRVAAWLHGVAVLAARKARAGRLKRFAREDRLDSAPEPTATSPAIDPDLAEVLDDEIHRLPERYRLPILLCELRELPLARAAVELGWPVGTVASRLSRGRKMLANRLRQRGILATSAIFAAGSVSRVAATSLPAKLVLKATIPAATGAGLGTLPADPPLFREVMWAMTMTKVRAAAVGVMAVAAVATSGVGFFGATLAAPVPSASAKAAQDTADDALARVPADNLSAILKVKAVQTDLAMTEEQVKKCDTLRAKHNGGGIKLNVKGAGVVNPVGPAGAPGGIQIEAIADSFTLTDSSPQLHKALTEVLTAKQVRRVKQLSLQAKGPVALLDRRVIRALGLTAEQEDKIEAAIPAEPNGMIQIQVNGVVRDPIAEKREAAWTTTLEVLTKEQRAKWDAMVGEMLPAAELRKVGLPDITFGEIQNLIPGGQGVVPPMPVPNQDDDD